MEQSCAQLKLRNAFSVLVGIDAVNVMAAYQPVVQACGSQWREELSSCLHCEPQEHRKPIS